MRRVLVAIVLLFSAARSFAGIAFNNGGGSGASTNGLASIEYVNAQTNVTAQTNGLASTAYVDAKTNGNTVIRFGNAETTNAAVSNFFMGTVGIGTNIPGYQLEVLGSTRLNGTVRFDNALTAYGNISLSGSTLYGDSVRVGSAAAGGMTIQNFSGSTNILVATNLGIVQARWADGSTISSGTNTTNTIAGPMMLGVGTLAPGEQLRVEGNSQLRGTVTLAGDLAMNAGAIVYGADERIGVRGGSAAGGRSIRNQSGTTNMIVITNNGVVSIQFSDGTTQTSASSSSGASAPLGFSMGLWPLTTTTTNAMTFAPGAIESSGTLYPLTTNYTLTVTGAGKYPTGGTNWVNYYVGPASTTNQIDIIATTNEPLLVPVKGGYYMATNQACRFLASGFCLKAGELTTNLWIKNICMVAETGALVLAYNFFPDGTWQTYNISNYTHAGVESVKVNVTVRGVAGSDAGWVMCTPSETNGVVSVVGNTVFQSRGWQLQETVIEEAGGSAVYDGVANGYVLLDSSRQLLWNSQSTANRLYTSVCGFTFRR